MTDILFVELTRGEFDQNLSDWGEYSCTLPTATTIGKKWFRNNDAFRRGAQGHIARAETKMADAFPDWWMGEYAEHDPPNPNRVRIIWRKVRIIESTSLRPKE